MWNTATIIVSLGLVGRCEGAAFWTTLGTGRHVSGLCVRVHVRVGVL